MVRDSQQNYPEEIRRKLVARVAAMRAAGVPLGAACREVGISEVSYYKWARAFGQDPVIRPRRRPVAGDPAVADPPSPGPVPVEDPAGPPDTFPAPDDDPATEPADDPTDDPADEPDPHHRDEDDPDCDEDERARRRRDYRAIIRALRRRPGVWIGLDLDLPPASPWTWARPVVGGLRFVPSDPAWASTWEAIGPVVGGLRPGPGEERDHGH